jgi:SET domain-containing protein
VPAGLEIKHGRLGRGVFAARHFEKGDAVETCPTLTLPNEQVVGRLGDYVFGSNEGEHEVLLLLGFGMLYNHSSEPNVEYVQGEEPDTITFVATQPIEPGDELTIDYGEEWWETRDLEPD